MKRVFIILVCLPFFTNAQNIITIAGNGTAGNSGDGGPATTAAINGVWGSALDRAGNLYIADRFNNRIRKISPSGIITNVAGTGAAGASRQWRPGNECAAEPTCGYCH